MKKQEVKKSDSPICRALRSMRFDFRNVRFAKTQREVAEKVGVSQSQLWAWEMGEKKIKDNELRALLNVYKTTRKDFDKLVLDMSDSGQPMQGAEANP